MAAPTPVTVMSMTELNELNPGSTIAEQLDELPQFFATPTAQRGGNAVSTTAGGSYLNLRGMGLNRTLVLLDGTRVAPADANGSVNVDNFPAALMERVDIVTGGASAAYGADAVAGVVNFVLNREFEGIKTKYSAGITDEQDGENYNFSIAGGHSFLDDKLHLTGSVDIKSIEQIGPSRDRFDESWWQDWGLVRNPAWVSATATPGVPQRITVPHVFGAQSSPQGLIITSTPGFAYRNWTFTDDGTDIRPFQFGDYLSLTGVTAGAGATNNQSGGPEYDYYDQSTTRSAAARRARQRRQARVGVPEFEVRLHRARQPQFPGDLGQQRVGVLQPAEQHDDRRRAVRLDDPPREPVSAGDACHRDGPARDGFDSNHAGRHHRRPGAHQHLRQPRR